MTPHNHGDYPQIMRNPQEKALLTEKFRKNQALFRKYTAVYKALKSDCNGGGTSLPVPTGGPSNVVQTGVHAHHDSIPFLKIWVDIRKQTRGECSEDDGDLQPCRTPCLIDIKIAKGDRIRASRRSDDFRRYDGVQNDHPFGANGFFNNNIREWRRQTTNQKTWSHYKLFLHWAHKYQIRAVTTAIKGGKQRRCNRYMVYLLPVQKIIMRQYMTYTPSCKECRHRATRWNDWHKPIQSLPAPNQW